MVWGPPGPGLRVQEPWQGRGFRPPSPPKSAAALLPGAGTLSCQHGLGRPWHRSRNDEQLTDPGGTHSRTHGNPRGANPQIHPGSSQRTIPGLRMSCGGRQGPRPQGQKLRGNRQPPLIPGTLRLQGCWAAFQARGPECGRRQDWLEKGNQPERQGALASPRNRETRHVTASPSLGWCH